MLFFLQNKHDYNVILILYNSLKKQVNIKVTNVIDTILPVFAPFANKKLFQTTTALFTSTEQHDGDSFLNDSIVK